MTSRRALVLLAALGLAVGFTAAKLLQEEAEPTAGGAQPPQRAVDSASTEPTSSERVEAHAPSEEAAAPSVEPFRIACSALDGTQALRGQPWVVEARALDDDAPFDAIAELLRQASEISEPRPTVLPVALVVTGMEQPIEHLLRVLPKMESAPSALRAFEIVLMRRSQEFMAGHKDALDRAHDEVGPAAAEMLDRVFARVPLDAASLIGAASEGPPRWLVKRLEVSRPLLRAGPEEVLRKALRVTSSRLAAESVVADEVGPLFDAASQLAHAIALRRTVVEESNRLAEIVNNMPAHKLDAARDYIRGSLVLRSLYRDKIVGLR